MKLLVAAACLAAGGAWAAPPPHPLVVCADPNNLPFSNREEQGFENKIASLVAKDMGMSVSYVWWPQRRGYVRKTLNAAKCDLWPGVAEGLENVASTQAYYRSTYVFVTREAAPLAHLNLDDARLETVKIGVQMIGNDAMNTPPAHAIASRGLINNVRGYMLYGDSSQPNPAAVIVNAVATGDIDIALVWGPLAGYFAQQSTVPLRIEPIVPANDRRWPMSFDIAIGVRRDDIALRNQINEVLNREKPTIDAILRAYHVPLEAAESTTS
jgi:mxaJ protein